MFQQNIFPLKKKMFLCDNEKNFLISKNIFVDTMSRVSVCFNKDISGCTWTKIPLKFQMILPIIHSLSKRTLLFIAMSLCKQQGSGGKHCQLLHKVRIKIKRRGNTTLKFVMEQSLPQTIR